MRVIWNPGQLTPTFDHTITILNKLNGRDSHDRMDKWKKTTLHLCSWTSQSVRTMSGASVLMGSSFIVRIPKSAEFKPYNVWKADMNGWTVSLGDYVVKGEIEEEVTAQTVQQIVNQHRPNAFEVRVFQDATGVIEALEHYRVEGV